MPQPILTGPSGESGGVAGGARSGSRDGTARPPGQRRGVSDPRRALLLLIVVSAALRLVLAGVLGLGVDESYEVAVSRGLSLSYFDHPPISFWIPGILARIAHSENRILMRFPFILLFAGTTWLMYRLTARLWGERAGFYAALLLNVSAVFSVSTGGWVLPDGPLMFFMVAAALCLERVLVAEREPPHATAWWLAAGALTGLALLSKYHGIFVAGGAFLFVLTRRESRGWLKRPAPYLATLVVFLLFTPVIWWNAHHGWASFRFQGDRGVPVGFHPLSFLQSVGGQAGYLLPWIWVPIVWLLVRGFVAGPRDAARWFLCCLAVGPIVFFTLPSFGGRPGLPHWEAPGYLFLFPLLGEAVDRWLREGRRWVRGWLRFSVASFLVLVAFAASDIATGWVAKEMPAAFPHGDPSVEDMDWNGLASTLSARGLLADTSRFVGVTSWIDAGKVAYALGPHVPVVCLCARPHQFGYLYPQTSFLGRDAVIVIRTPARDADPAARFRPYFRSVAPAGTLTLERAGNPAIELTLLVGHDFTRPVGETADPPAPAIGVARARAHGGYTYRRAYRPGARFDYVLTTDAWHDGRFASETLARSHHEVVLRDGAPWERVTFTSLEVATDSLHRHYISYDADAGRVAPFYLSLAPDAKLHMPKLTVPRMTAAVTDLVTYWVAMSGRVGVDSLHAPGDRYASPSPLVGRWAHGATMPVGEDVLSVTDELVAESDSTVTFRTSFEPPARQAMKTAYAWMIHPISTDGPNNFQQVMAAGPGTFNAMWGRERFTITTTVARESGIILHATMTNELRLRLRVGCDAALARCAHELPYAITRRERLELLPAR